MNASISSRSAMSPFTDVAEQGPQEEHSDDNDQSDDGDEAAGACAPPRFGYDVCYS